MLLIWKQDPAYVSKNIKKAIFGVSEIPLSLW
jgi:hypothetical protein